MLGGLILAVVILSIAARWRFMIRFFRTMTGRDEPVPLRRADLVQAFVLIVLMVGIGGWMVTTSEASWLTWLFFLGIVLYFFLLSGERSP